MPSSGHPDLVRGIRRLAATAILLCVTVVLTGCTPNNPVVGLTVVHGKIAIVVALCHGEFVSKVSTFQGNATGDGVTTTWEMTARPPRPGVLFFIGMPRAGFTTTVPLTSTPPGSDQQAMVVVDSTYWHGEYASFAAEDFAKAKPGSVLVNGSYISYASYMAEYQLCKQKEKNTSQSKGLW